MTAAVFMSEETTAATVIVGNVVELGWAVDVILVEWILITERKAARPLRNDQRAFQRTGLHDRIEEVRATSAAFHLFPLLGRFTLCVVRSRSSGAFGAAALADASGFGETEDEPDDEGTRSPPAAARQDLPRRADCSSWCTNHDMPRWTMLRWL